MTKIQINIQETNKVYAKSILTRQVFGFEQTCMYAILVLVTGPLGTSECAGDFRFSANLCKRALDVTAAVILEATRNADILTVNENTLQMSS